MFTSCFGHVDKRGSVLSYSNGLVKTEGGSFKIGLLSSSLWQKKSFNYKAILFEHKQKQASISVSSFCKGSFDDANLKTLTNQLYYNMTDQKHLFQQPLRMENRDALRTRISGRVDGAPIVMDVVVLKMNECVFDFALIAEPADIGSVSGDFEGLVKNFHFIRGPRID